MIILKDQLPIGHPTTLSDYNLIDTFLRQLRPLERAQVDATMSVNYPDQLLRTWKQYALKATQQVTIYRLTNPATAVAASAKS